MIKTTTQVHFKNHRLRIPYFFLAIATIAIGLATRKTPHLFHPFIVEYGGDTFWALLFFLLVRMIWLNKPIWLIATITYCFAVLIECSQLYQADWINRCRQTFFGQMILGNGFLWSDFLCYAVGVLLGCAIAYIIEKKRSKKITAIQR